MPVQLRFVTGLAGAEYVTRELWRLATLECCPLHPRGGCGFARHGTYARKTPAGTLIARWYCPRGHQTFSLLPDHLAARFPGTLAEIERVGATVEAAPSLSACVEELRPDPVSLPSALRWIRRRLAPVRALLPRVVTMLPQCLAGCPPRIATMRQRLGVDCLLPALRGTLSTHLHVLLRPLGFADRACAPGAGPGGRQHDMGPDPPPAPS
ncbi:MAG: hypothetical protein H7Y33_03605 [Cytophagales bacterium]|nr:hypothetical protein [Rhizobacter sp.]